MNNGQIFIDTVVWDRQLSTIALPLDNYAAKKHFT